MSKSIESQRKWMIPHGVLHSVVLFFLSDILIDNLIPDAHWPLFGKVMLTLIANQTINLPLARRADVIITEIECKKITDD